MKERISEIRIDPEKVAAEGGGISKEKLMAELKRRTKKRGSITIIRESIDARRKPDVKLVYTIEIGSEGASANPPVSDFPADDFVSGDTPSNHTLKGRSRPVIAGFGPCGIFAALVLAEAGMRPIVIERGKAVDERVDDVERFWRSAGGGRCGDGSDPGSPDPESNVQFGEGGAGTFSDGKLTTGIKDVRIRKILEEFVRAGAPKEILYKHKPHIGTDRLRRVVKNLRLRIEELGGEVRFGTRLEDMDIRDGVLKGVRLSGGNEIEATALILAIGHSARDTFGMLSDKGFDMKQKPFSIGVRIEHPQEMINRVQYGNPQLAEILGPAEYKLSYRCGEDCPGSIAGRGVYTFCMCPGGRVVNASTEAGTSVTNGMSNSARDGENANSALLVDVRTSDYAAFGGGRYGTEDPLAGVEFQKKYEQLAWQHRTAGGMAQESYGHFKVSEDSVVRKSLPAFASEAILEAMPHLGRKLRGFDSDEGIMTAVETRSSSPVRIIRDEKMEAQMGGRAIGGVIPAGEGPGYAGGIVSAAVDGIKAAEMIIAAANRI
ncbi:MAG: NAD(FAD)-utilizing dehydrogenase [Bacillota bacterium]|nr:NAD(FAD)-utilizing dehydrogenase [Bacillota bacterium]